MQAELEDRSPFLGLFSTLIDFHQTMVSALCKRVTACAKSLTFGQVFGVILDHGIAVAISLSFHHCLTSLNHLHQLQRVFADRRSPKICIDLVDDLHLELNKDLVFLCQCCMAAGVLLFIRVYGPLMLDITYTVGSGLNHVMLGPWLAITRYLWPQLKIEIINRPQNIKSSSDPKVTEIATTHSATDPKEVRGAHVQENRRASHDSLLTSDAGYEILNAFTPTSSQEEYSHISHPSFLDGEMALPSPHESRMPAVEPMTDQKIESAIAAQASVVSKLERSADRREGLVGRLEGYMDGEETEKEARFYDRLEEIFDRA